MVNRCKNPSLDQLMKEYKSKTIFDISYILKGNRPNKEQLDKMKTSIKEHAPVKFFYFVYESQNKIDFDRFCRGPFDTFNVIDNYWIAWDLMVKLKDYQGELLRVGDEIPYDFRFSESSINTQKLKLYMLY